MRIIDTHCHLNFRAYKADIDEVIRRCFDKNVEMITVGTQKDTSQVAVEIAKKYKGIWATVALHPNHLFPVEIDEKESSFITREESFDYDLYKELAQNPEVVAIGECGLDWFRVPEDVELEKIKQKQVEVFEKHLDLADELGLPVVIHCRDAHEDCFKVLKKYIDEGKLKKRGVAHCFTGTLGEAQKYHELGFLTSFTGIITFPPKKSSGEKFSELQKVVQEVPLEMIMLDTDAPYLAPEPYRGKKAEPWHAIFIAEKNAELKGLTYEEVIKTTTKNAEKLFNI